MVKRIKSIGSITFPQQHARRAFAPPNPFPDTEGNLGWLHLPDRPVNGKIAAAIPTVTRR
jgi:hypothetical protein